MDTFKQKTIAHSVSVKGTGLHTAHKVEVTFRPGPVDSGIVFVRTDLPDKPGIKAGVDHILADSGNFRCSAIGNAQVQIYTIEHLMAALVGLGIDNLIIEIDNNEVPGLDGSSAGWVELLRKAGIAELDKPAAAHVIREPLYVEEGGCTIVALPYQGYKVSYTLDYDHAFLRSGFLEFVVTPEAFQKEIGPARTFCLDEEAAELQRRGMGKGATYENTLVVGKQGVVKNTLRFEDEFIRHKMLDLIGDLSLLGQPLCGHIIAVKSGHSLNMKLLRKIDQQRQRALLGGIQIQSPPAGAEELDSDQVMRVLPHRYPFLLVDRILSLERGKKAVGIKNVTINDNFFQGHFPGKPVMPGVLIIEAMAQVGGVMMLSTEENRGKIAYFMSIKDAKFRKTVVPGDQLVMEIVAGKIKAKIGQVAGKAYVQGKLVAEAELMFALAE
jgi:UDP-3-O-[3-hydroxymyristoyl] N-acetylglucosamine deacetylase / 3-hydroxyacyl-[acyl-carrier-protein] dehydratase